MIRQPIVVLVGHIDHGKSSILEHVKEISITSKEAGGITQSIHSYTISLERLQQCCGDLLKMNNTTLALPGLLFLDSPGHAAFQTMRKRGGSLSDLAILVIDVISGVEEQTIECLKILKEYKTPFLIALNKIDKISGWQSHAGKTLLETIAAQTDRVTEDLEVKLYKVAEKLAEFSITADRFDRVSDFTKTVAIVPISAKTEDGLPELVMLLVGLAQRFLEKSLQTNAAGPGKATILEVTEEPGIGTALDVIVYDGCVKVNDTIMIGTLGEPIITKARALFEPDTKAKKLLTVKEVHAARGVRLLAPDLKGVLGGMPLYVVPQHASLVALAQKLKEEIQEVVLETDKEGVIAKADTIGSLEALSHLLRQEKIPIRRASLGAITKKDLADAATAKDPLHRVVLGFCVAASDGQDAHQITHEVIYQTLEEYSTWQKETQKKLEAQQLEGMIRPCRMKILRGCIFRQSNPAVFGVYIQAGKLSTGTPLMKEDGSALSEVKSLQQDGENHSEVEQGKETAVSVSGIVVGRHVREDDVLYADVSEKDFIAYKKLKKYLSPAEIEVLKEVAVVKRKQNKFWGV